MQLGWEALATLFALDANAAAAADAALEAISAEVTNTLAFSEQQIAVPSLRLLEAFYTAVEQLVLPRLQALGIDAAAAWANRYRAR